MSHLGKKLLALNLLEDSYGYVSKQLSYLAAHAIRYHKAMFKNNRFTCYR